MQRRRFVIVTAASVAAANTAVVAPAWALSETDAASGIRAALERGALAAVGLLGKENGFLGNELVRIALPNHLEDIARVLRATGQKKRVDELVTSMNRAAEKAVPLAKGLLVGAARKIGVDDAIRIVRGSSTQASAFHEK